MWFKVDDRLHVHRKTRRLLSTNPKKRVDAAPMGLWVLAGSWAGQNAHEVGWVPEYELDRWDDNWQELAQRLVKAGFWWPEERDGEPGFAFVNWEEYSPINGASEKGQFGNHKRWHINRGIVDPECIHCPQEPSSDPQPSPPDRGAIPSDIGVRIANTIAPDRITRAIPEPDPEPDPEPGGRGRDTAGAALVPVGPATTDVAAPKSKKGIRLPEDWQPSRTDGNIAAEAGRDPEWLTDQLERFRNYWIAKSGKDATKLDWDRTWQNWLKRADDFAPRKQAMTGANLTGDDWDRWATEAAAKDANTERNSA